MVASEFLQSKLVLMVLLTITKLILWPKVTHIFCLDNGDTFSLVSKMVCFLIYTVNIHLSLHFDLEHLMRT